MSFGSLGRHLEGKLATFFTALFFGGPRGRPGVVFRVIWGSFFTLFEVSLAPLSNETRVPEKHPRKTHGKYKKKRARI